ncbi:hypothetical protein AAMO2058_001566100 [Amorphochlora amoebiformis]|mmetsp:Transcript_15938/g.25224  ORF Transcript_15938/g.25224 Transcript_15938/m.25224 type:complete len:135 (-) Transcript_15938:228-632(-)
MKLMQSLKSNDYVHEIFNWQWMYYSLTNPGIEYLRKVLHIPDDTVPKTLKKQAGPPIAERGGYGGRGRGRGGFSRDRGDYRGPRDGGDGGYRRGGFRGGGFRGRGRGMGMGGRGMGGGRARGRGMGAPAEMEGF